MRNLHRLAVCVPLVVGAALPGLGPVHAAGRPVNGCPNGYTLMAIAPLAAQGYRVPGRLDDPTSGERSFGRPGNGDGYTCAQEIGNRTTPWGGQLYQFWDNVLPA